MADVVSSPNKPRPDDPFIIEIADMLARIQRNYEREGSGPASRFEGRLLEDVQAERIARAFRESPRRIRRSGAYDDARAYLSGFDSDAYYNASRAKLQVEVTSARIALARVLSEIDRHEGDQS